MPGSGGVRQTAGEQGDCRGGRAPRVEAHRLAGARISGVGAGSAAVFPGSRVIDRFCPVGTPADAETPERGTGGTGSPVNNLMDCGSGRLAAGA
jgi:hypothetical protein